VVLIDEAARLGGQYFKRRHGAVLAKYGDYRPEGTRLIAAVHESGVRVRPSRLVWGVDDDGRTLLTASLSQGEPLAVTPRAIIVATGAYERVIPFPGWQLPGVVTPGHALHLATCDLVPLGQRVLVAGTGPFLLAAACAVLRAGGGVLAVAELNRPYTPSRAALAAVRYPARLAELAGYLATLARHRVPIWPSCRVMAAAGGERVSEVRLNNRTITVDALAVGYGFRPATELLRLLGADTTQDELGDVYPRLDPAGRTSVPGVYAAGEVTQIAGVRAALAGGRLTAAAVAADLGLPLTEPKTAATRLAAERRFAALTGRLFPVTPEDLARMPDHTMVCRCEGVTAAELRRAAAAGRHDASAAKAVTRAGMGPCQGRQCGAAAAALIGAAAGQPAPAFTARMPVKPVPVSALIGWER
jgi:thioredoxin reductase/bacterioferritin-associated ferredoxin